MCEKRGQRSTPGDLGFIRSGGVVQVTSGSTDWLEERLTAYIRSRCTNSVCVCVCVCVGRHEHFCHCERIISCKWEPVQRGCALNEGAA